MNHLVFLDAMTGELEKILSGTKTMLIKEFDPRKTAAHPVCAGDSLYFLRDKDDCALRVQATVVRVLSCAKPLNEDLSHTMKEMQSRLQLTEDQYNYWSAKEQVLLVEFGSAQKISLIPLAAKKIKDRSVPGYLPQDFGVYPNLSAQEFLEYMAAIKGMSGAKARRKISDLLDLVNLREAARRPLGGYSGGMRQRVGIAQALLNDPQLLIVDEPTVGLDSEEPVESSLCLPWRWPWGSSPPATGSLK